MGAADGLERTLLAVVARCLRVPVQAIDPSAPLTRYGLDSLLALELAEAVATATGLDVTEDAFFDAPSVHSLAVHLLLQMPVGNGMAPPLERMRADAVLDRDIGAAGLSSAPTDAYLVTGANGFLGTHVLHALSAGGAREVVCLVRAPDDAAAQDRLSAALRSYGMPASLDRVRVLAADIAAARFGLSPARYAALAQTAGTIVHCAADVNWAASYEMLRAANVEATRALLRFACTGTAKPFHFVSSVSAGLATGVSSPFDEGAPIADPAGLHLGYAQTKWVAERLVEAARERGLPGAIHRPSLIAGHSVTGFGNDDDLFSRMLRGCVELGHAPDLDWPLDACPVDFVAAAIAALASASTAVAPVLHLRNPHPACWTEAVLWMNVRGYAVKLEPYAAWIERVRREVRADHPLHALRAFLSSRPVTQDGCHLPELYARPRVREVRAARSQAALAAVGITCPRLGARQLEHYFERWVATGRVRAPERAVPAPRADAAESQSLQRELQRLLRRYFAEPTLQARVSDRVEFGCDHSLIGELVSWRAGSRYAMQACRVELARDDARRSRIDLVIKSSLPDDVVLDVMTEAATLCDPALGAAFAAYRDASEFAGARTRECALYAGATGALREAMPLCFGTLSEGASAALVLERIGRTRLVDAVDDAAAWTQDCIEAALTGIARVHGEWLGRAQALAARDVLAVADAGEAARAWWEGGAAHAGGWLRAWLGTSGAAAHASLARQHAGVARWIAAQSCTLIHGDFNPRNVAIRDTALGPRLGAFDWELAAWGLPQRDIAEFLCFVLDPERAALDAPRYMEAARLAVQRSARRDVSPAWWHAGMRAALAQFGVTRLPMYFLAHRFRPQTFLPRVVRCWWRLAAVFGTAP